MSGWNITLRDHDGHLILHNGRPGDISRPIIIGDHTWICSEVDMLKGAQIGSDCIVGYGSLMTHSYTENHIIIAGYPVKKIKDNIDWSCR